MVTILSYGTRTARKHHQCFECYRAIAPQQKYGFQTNVYDGRVYTLAWHLDCGEFAHEYRKTSDWYDDGEGFPPLRDMMCYGEYEADCDAWRGFYPHVVARMELTDQLYEARK